MSARTLADITAELSHGAPIQCPRLNLAARHLFVLTPSHDRHGISGYLAEQVTASQAALTARYMAPGGTRARLPREVRYYVAKITGHVLAVMLANGQVVTDFPSDYPPRRRAAIEAGLDAQSARLGVMGE